MSYYIYEVIFMLNKIHEFAFCMGKGCLFGIPLMGVAYILWGIVYVITGVIDKKVN